MLTLVLIFLVGLPTALVALAAAVVDGPAVALLDRLDRALLSNDRRTP